jgi:hypothetical protein
VRKESKETQRATKERRCLTSGWREEGKSLEVLEVKDLWAGKVRGWEAGVWSGSVEGLPVGRQGAGRLTGLGRLGLSASMDEHTIQIYNDLLNLGTTVGQEELTGLFVFSHISGFTGSDVFRGQRIRTFECGGFRSTRPRFVHGRLKNLK